LLPFPRDFRDFLQLKITEDTMRLKKLLCFAVACAIMTAAFAQPSALRDYVGVIRQSYHPDVVEYLEIVRERFIKHGENDYAKFLENYLKGGFGTGFVYVAPDGENYILTNNHVISRAYTLSITFEKLDGGKTTYDKLRIVAADEDIDIAILAFSDGAKPFSRGLSFVSAPAEEGAPVFAAGFPGLGMEAVWQFSSGMISNAAVRFPADPELEMPEAALGPYIQHTAPIDMGNSGGPLLVQQTGVTTGYAVAGINTLQARFRQNANFSIPATRAQSYVQSALVSRDETALRAALDKRLDSFVKGLSAPKAAYPHIAQYLSNACTASNAEYAVSEVFERGSRTVQEDMVNIVRSPLYGMNIAVAWLIEDSMRGKNTGAIRASLGEIAKNPDGSYHVPMQFAGDRVVNTVWVNEYGIWKLDKAGDLVSGDKTLLEKKQKERQERDRLRTDYGAAFAVDFAYIFDDRPALRLAIDVRSNNTLYEVQAFIAQNKYFDVSFLVGIEIPIIIKNKAAVLPFGAVGLGLTLRDELSADDEVTSGGWKYSKKEWYSITGEKSSKNAEFGIAAKAGAKVMISAVPGLFGEIAYQFNYFFGREDWVKDNDQHRIIVGIGYAF
jgi:serine protease Do